jgi:hypothetical protein
MSTKIYVTIGGGCYLDSRNVPVDCEIKVIDWDNLLDDDSTHSEWELTDSETRDFIKKNYPEEHALIQKRLSATPAHI